ncbi:phosphatidylinositol mannoside acyltransferase [Actinomarinicola tropica]|uniref:Phosphatidylinositol mannoside acyltransferase n=1 Tax=Actinomarinicola tropica TaxID=2789776 RepID=A0A5Q2RM21_9ACTN|nr:phosphatidylinositol mannoside acyltransferase [Actinomarinicola tropica]QGG95137.1 phosphatidylinositol mannoside acyltransferase [Actinomarinicola tropica]
MSRPPVVQLYRAGAALARAVPAPVARGVARTGGTVASRALHDRRAQVERNLRRVDPSLSGRHLRRAVDATFASYGRYWAESFRLTGLDAGHIDRGFSYTGYDHVVAAREQGSGVIIALPHLGGWEWAAFWLAAIEDVPVTAVVEALEPPELFEWFVDFRRALGMNVVPLGPAAGGEVLRALKAGHAVCLLSDRDIGGGGVEVELFGERTTLPAGPATLALRTGAPILPTAIYFDGDLHRARVDPPLAVERRGSLRDDVARVTQDLAHALEDLIRAAPEQWHLMQPNWPSDRADLGH